jgi:hypothetical protein
VDFERPTEENSHDHIYKRTKRTDSPTCLFLARLTAILLCSLVLGWLFPLSSLDSSSSSAEDFAAAALADDFFILQSELFEGHGIIVFTRFFPLRNIVSRDARSAIGPSERIHVTLIHCSE